MMMTEAPHSLPQSVLVVDDDDAFRTRLAKGLADRGFDVRTAGDASEALEVARSDPPEVAIVDLRMPGESGLTLVDGLKAIDATTRVVVLTGWGSIGTAVDAIKRGASHYLQKPVTVDALVGSILGDDAQSPAPGDELPTLGRLEWEYIQRVMAECGDNVSEAARRLHMHRRSLQRKLQKRPPAR
jgi:two-component system response regulator RegA